eukprot:COSAG01_NODE_16_length_40091_cov_15.728646_39_plen_75_part_00
MLARGGSLAVAGAARSLRASACFGLHALPRGVRGAWGAARGLHRLPGGELHRAARPCERRLRPLSGRLSLGTPR